METIYVELSDGKKIGFLYSRRAQMRIESLPMITSQGSLAQVCQTAWALQPGNNPKNTPEDFADIIQDEDVEAVVEGINKAMELADSKNSKGIQNGQSSE